MHTSSDTEERRAPDRGQGDSRTFFSRILQHLGELAPLLQPLLLGAPLSAEERLSFAPLMFVQASRLVRVGIRLLREHSADLADAEEDPQALAALQDRADLLGLVRANLMQLLTLVDDAYVATQAEAVQRVRTAARRQRMITITRHGKADPRRLLQESLLARLDAWDPRSPKTRTPRGGRIR